LLTLLMPALLAACCFLPLAAARIESLLLRVTRPYLLHFELRAHGASFYLPVVEWTREWNMKFEALWETPF